MFGIPQMSRFYRHVLIEDGYPHHGAVAFGDVGKYLYEIFKWLGVTKISFNQPKGMLYPTENPFESKGRSFGKGTFRRAPGSAGAHACLYFRPRLQGRRPSAAALKRPGGSAPRAPRDGHALAYFGLSRLCCGFSPDVVHSSAFLFWPSTGAWFYPAFIPCPSASAGGPPPMAAALPRPGGSAPRDPLT